MTPEQRALVGMLVRAVMILGGGQYLEEGGWDMVIGGLVILGALGWSAYQKLKPKPVAPDPIKFPARELVSRYGKKVN